MSCPRHPPGQEKDWCMDCHPERYEPTPGGEAHARSSDPWTSHHAARSIPEDELRESQRCVLQAFRHLGEMHHELLLERYRQEGWQYRWKAQSDSGLRSRANELWKAGYLEDTGRVVILPSKRPSIIWRATGTPAEWYGIVP